jgi:hypothetical protein
MKTPRRGFLLSVAAAPLVPVLASAQAAPPSSPAAPPPGTPAADPVTDALLEVVKRRYGAQLEPGDLEAVRKALGEARQMGDRLKAGAPLGNPDEPATVFEARPRGGRERKGVRK